MDSTWNVEVAYRRALQVIADQDHDFAATENKVGFSRYDTQIGHSLLEMPVGSWSPAQLQMAYKMLGKYQNTQLHAAGVVYGDLPKPPKQKKLAGDTVRRQDARIWVEGDVFCLQWDTRDPLMYDRLGHVRQIAAARFDPERRLWRVPISMASADAVAKMIGAFTAMSPFVVDDAVQPAIDAAFIEGDELLAASRADDAADVEIHGIREPDRIRPFQRAGIAYAARTKRCLIADDMGLGKTLQALAVATTLDAQRVLIVCPASLKLNWKREIDLWVDGDRSTMLLEGTKPHDLMRDFGFGRFTIINYDVLHAWAPQLSAIPWDVIIADECHMAKSYKARRTKALKQVVQDSDPQSVLMLSGTPMMNRPSELWPVLQMVNGERVFGGWDKFALRYCDAQQTRFGFQANGAANLEELNTKLRGGGLMVRRRKTDVLKELPDRQWSEMPIDMSAKAAREYADIEREIAEADTPGAALAGISKLRRAAWQAKQKTVKQWIDNFLESDEKLVVFGWHRDVIEALQEWYNAPVIIGGMKREDVETNKALFQEDPSVRVIAANIMAGGLGHTLTAASNCVFAEFAWNGALMDQALDRVHRIGQEADSVTGWLMPAVREGGAETVDQMMLDMIAHKRDVTTRGSDGSGRSVQSKLLAKWRSALIEEELATIAGENEELAEQLAG